MSLNTVDAFLSEKHPQDKADSGEQRDLAMITRYLAVLEENKNAGRAALRDADLALDMAGFTCRRLNDPAPGIQLPPALLALALVQRVPDAPEQ